MSIQGYSGLFSVSKASLIDTEHRLLEQIKLAGTRCFLKGPWHPFVSFLQLWLVRKVHKTLFFALVCFFWQEGGWRHVTGLGFRRNNNLPIRPEISPANLTLAVCLSNTKRQRGKWERWRKWHPRRVNVCVQDRTLLAKKFRKKLTLEEMEEAGRCKT